MPMDGFIIFLPFVFMGVSLMFWREKTKLKVLTSQVYHLWCAGFIIHLESEGTSSLTARYLDAGNADVNCADPV
jgi:hypothetical protein